MIIYLWSLLYTHNNSYYYKLSRASVAIRSLGLFALRDIVCAHACIYNAKTFSGHLSCKLYINILSGLGNFLLL